MSYLGYLKESFMKTRKFLSLFLSLLLLTPHGAFATKGIIMVEGQDEFIQLNEKSEPMVCQKPDGEICSSGLDEKPLEDLAPVMNAAQVSEPPSCKNDDLKFGDNELPDEEAAKIKQDLLKQCNKAFKKHKRAFAKQLLSNGRIFGAMQVLMRKKKKLKDISNEYNSEKLSVKSDNLEDLNKKIKEEEDKIVEAFKKEFPGGFDESDPYYNDNKKLCNGKYSLGVDGKLSTPSHIYVEKGDTTCKVDIDVPKIQDVKLPPANLIPPLDITDSFPDDCAFMVSDKFSEADALKLLGAKSRSDYCSSNQDITKSDEVKKDAQGKNAFDYLDQLSDSFTQAAEEGMTPDFTLNVSRNLYRDEVRPLAQKRGEFVQKYLFKQLQENAKEIENAPAWMTQFDEFAKVFKLKYPTYEGQSTVGDFGPNPSASAEEFDQEKQNLKLTLEKKVVEIQKSILSIEDKNSGSIKKLNDLIAAEKKLKKDLEANVSKLSKSMEKKKDFSDINTGMDELNALNQELYKATFRIAQSERSLKEESDMLNYHKARLTKTNPAAQVGLLDQFYKNRPEGFDRDYKNAWDEKLFKKFKMVAVEGTFKGDKEFEPDLNNEITPKIQYALDKIIRSQAFSCDYSIKDLKRHRYDGWDKGDFKLGKWARKNIWNPTFMTIKFVAGGELLLLGKLLKKIPGPTDCPNWGNKNLYRSYMRWGSKKVYGGSGKVGWFDIDKKYIEYEGDYGVCVEEEK